jgi:hypothetical protein
MVKYSKVTSFVTNLLWSTEEWGLGLLVQMVQKSVSRILTLVHRVQQLYTNLNPNRKRNTVF